MKVKVHVFWLGHFARSKFESERSFPMKYYIITILKKKIEHFGLFLTKYKNEFPIVFSNLARKGSKGFSQARGGISSDLYRILPCDILNVFFSTNFKWPNLL